MTLPGLRPRVVLLALVLGAGFLGVTLRLVQLQVVHHQAYAAKARRQQTASLTIHAVRGPIVDRHGALLAISRPAWALVAHPARIKADDRAPVAADLSELLGLPGADLEARLSASRGEVIVQRKLSPDVADTIRSWGIGGLELRPDSRRSYPNAELAAHVLGFEGADGGLEGVERAWDRELSARPGRGWSDTAARGRPAALREVVVPARSGRGVRLTLDVAVQHAAEREVERAWRATGAKSAMAVVLEPASGDILAIALRPTFDPNAYERAPGRGHWRNRAITDPFEPGSTFKAILAAAALERGIVGRDDPIFAEHGRITVAGRAIRDWKPFGWLTFSEVLEQSSNVGAIKVGLRLGAEAFHDTMVRFGFGQATGIGLGGESRGLLRGPGQWSALSLPALSIGQEVSVTALQMVTAFGAIANQGVLMQPRIVLGVDDGQSSDADGREPRALRRVMSRETAATLTDILGRVVSSGTGRLAALEGYTVAGKTGTAQKKDPAGRGYSHAPGVLSFVGFVPAEAPRVVMLTLLDEPKTEKWGSEAAAPMFAAIAREILPRLGVRARGAETVELAPAGGARGRRADGQGPVGTLPLAASSGASGRPTVSSGASQAVSSGASQAVSSGASQAVSSGTSQAISSATAQAEARRMPDLQGVDLRMAVSRLTLLDVVVELTGRGRVISQAPAAGEPVAPGATVALVLARPAAPAP